MIIDFHKCYGGGGSGSGVTPQEVQAQIDSALTPYWESGETKDYVDGAVSGISLDGYYTSAETDSAISQAVAPFYTSAQTDEKIASAVTPVANHLAEVEQITASAYTELHDGLMEVSARTMPDMSLYTPTSGFSTINGSAITNGGNIVIQGGGGGDMSAYWNSAQTKSYVDSAATNLQDQIDTMDEVVADALNDLNGDLAAVSGVVHDFTYGMQPVVRTMHDLSVPSTPVTRIISLPQTSYDSLENDGLISPHTFYIIVNNS